MRGSRPTLPILHPPLDFALRSDDAYDAPKKKIGTIHVMQGECASSDSPSVVLMTFLGSCVCTCICDPDAKVGGMNHFLLPDTGLHDQGQLRYGLHAMELLINAVLKLGARRDKIQAKLFGGAMMSERLGSIGRANAAFALRFLETEGIICAGQSLGGNRARRVRFWPTSGRAQQMFLKSDELLSAEQPEVRVKGGAGDVIFF